MIQFNLLPDVKLEYIKTRRTQRLVISVSLLLSLCALFIFLFLFFTVHVFQRKNISDLNKDIKSTSAKLQGIPELDKILTVQGQLISLPGLHDDKVAATRTFGYIQAVTPTKATISSFQVDYTASTATITGEAPNLTEVNTFTDALKFTTFDTSDGTVSGKKAFSNVVLSSFTRDEKTANYTITLSFEPAIFSNASEVKLTVPSITSTRSKVDQPGDIFKDSGAGQSR